MQHFFKHFKSPHRRAVLAMIAANTIWGAASPIFKLALTNIPPFTLAYFRFFLASLLLFPLASSRLKIKRKDWPLLILTSLSSITVNITFFFLGLRLAPSINAPVIASAGPIFLYIISVVYLKEKLRFRVLLGTIVSLIGVIVIVGQPVLGRGDGKEILGNFFFVLATIGAVGHVVFTKKMSESYHPFTTEFWSFLIGSLTFFPFFFYEWITLKPYETVNSVGLLGLAFGVLLSSTVAYTLFAYGTKEINAQDVGVFAYMDPIVAAVIAYFLLGETISSVFLTGSILVVLGIFVAEKRLHYHPFGRLWRVNGKRG